MNIYEIDSRMRWLENLPIEDEMIIDEETGELIRIEDALDKLGMERREKLENIVRLIKNLGGEDSAIRTEAARLKDRHESITKRLERLKRYVADAQTDETGETHKFSCAAGDVTFRKTQAVNVTNEELLPEEFCNRKIISQANKVAIKEAIQAGRTIPGAELVQNRSVIIK